MADHVSGYLREHACPVCGTPILTPRQLQVLKYVVAGHTNNEIAEAFYIRYHSVKNVVSSVYRRLGVKNREEAIIYAYEKGIVRPQAEAREA